METAGWIVAITLYLLGLFMFLDATEDMDEEIEQEIALEPELPEIPGAVVRGLGALLWPFVALWQLAEALVERRL